MNKRVASAGLAAGLLAGGVAGLALGVTNLSSAATQSPAAAGTETSTTVDGSSTTTDDSTDTTTDDSTGTTTDDGTTDDGTTDDSPDRGQWLQDALQPLVDDGTITQAQADAVITALQDARPEGGFGHGPGGRHGGPGFGHGPGAGRLEDAATALGMTEDELRTALQDGSTIAEIAAEKGVELQTVVDAMLADLKTHLDEEVAAGDLTQEEADAKLAEVTERLTERLNQAPEVRPDDATEDTQTS